MDGSNLGSLERSELRMKEALDRTGASLMKGNTRRRVVEGTSQTLQRSGFTRL